MYRNIKATDLVNRFVFFGRNSGIHGLRHICSENANFIASNMNHEVWWDIKDLKLHWHCLRFFWTLIMVVSAGCLYLILAPVLERSEQVNFTPDTRYLAWQTTFPAVTICEMFFFRTVLKKFAALYPELMDPLLYEHRKYLTELAYGQGTCSKTFCVPCGTTVPCDVHWREIIENVHKKCSELLTDCKFNGKAFPCCKKFRQVESEYGYCYSFNTLQNEHTFNDVLYSVNLTTGPGLLTFRLLSEAHVSVHSPEELSTDELDYKFKFDVKPASEKSVEYLFSIVEIENDPMLQLEDKAVRGCRYLNEIPLEPMHVYPVYSYGACRLAQKTQRLYEECGCVHPVRDPLYKEYYCNYTGMNCLVQSKGKNSKSDLDQQSECLPSCAESELTTIHIFRNSKNRYDAPGTFVKVRMSSLPTLRYQRNLIRTDLDLVVSIGGIVGLFFAASVLSAAEIVYLLCRTQT